MSKEKIIVALDVETANEARKIVENLRGEVGAFKIGLQLFTAAGASFAREMVEAGVKIFLDVKFHDIPNTVAKASVEAARLGVWMFNVHALGGGEMMRRASNDVREICARENLIVPKIIGVTVLTSSNDETLREVGIESDAAREVLKLAKLAEKSGLDGVVASPREVELIRRETEKKDFLIVTPGIRNSNAEIQNQKTEIQNHLEISEDQKRVMNAGEAVRAGANYLVIGRPILKAENPISAVREILAGIKSNA